jgi:hypothetical protein
MFATGLAQWVKRQRYQYKLKLEGKRSTLSDERVRLLSTIGFIWNSHDAVFHERLQDLTLFKQIHGHCAVPSNYEPDVQLAVWTKRQRRQYKKYQEGSPSSMTPERISKLEAIGFVWDCRKLNNELNPEYKNPSAMSDNAVSATPATNSGEIPPSPSISNSSLVAQQQELLMLRNHQPKNQLVITNSKNKNNNVQRQEGASEDGNLTATKATTTYCLPEADQKTDEDHVGGTANATVIADSNQAASQQLRQKQIDQALLRLPKCEFFSFSRKFHH